MCLGYIFEQFEERYFYFGVVFMGGSLAMAFVGTILTRWPVMQLVVVLATAGVFVVLLVVVRPYSHGWKNAVAIAVWGVSGLQLTVNFVSSIDR